MTEPSSVLNADEVILLQFQQNYEAATDKAAFLQQQCELHPTLAARFRARAAMLPILGGLEPEPVEPLPERFGEFRVVRQIGRGGMGRVYEARHERLNRRVAVKTIRPDRASPIAIDRFHREQRALARLHQTHIVSIFEAGEEGPVHYFAMPYIDGAALSHVVQTALQRETAVPHSKTPSLAKLAADLAVEHEMDVRGSTAGPSSGHPVGAGRTAALSPEVRTAKLVLSAEYFRSVAEAMADAADAIQHAHEAGLLHRDVKPSNLMVDRDGHCWVIDFGLAGEAARRDGEGPPADSLLAAEPVTATGILGTPQYMAPEQWSQEKCGSQLDVRTDVYGLGVTLYELLTLRRAFDGETNEAISKNVLAAKPARIEELTTNVPADLMAICGRAMQKDPRARYQRTQGFADDLRRWLRHEPTEARGAWVGRRMWLWGRRNPGWAATVLLGTVAVVLGVVTAMVELRSWAKEAEAETARALQEAQERDYELRLLQLQRARFGQPFGWSRERLELVRDHYKDRPAEAKRKGRDEAAATLTGLDAVSEKQLKQDAGSLAFSRDGKRLVLGGVNRFSGGHAESGGVYDRETDRMTPSEMPGEGSEGPVGFTADGKPLQLVAANAYTLRLWDVNRQRTVRGFSFAEKVPSVRLGADNRPTLALSADGSLVAGSTKLPDGKGVLVVWEVETGKEIARISAKAEVMAFSPDKAILATGDDRGTLTLRPVREIEKGMTLPPGRLRVHCLAFTRDPLRRHKEGSKASGWLLAAGEAGGGITIWDVERKVPRIQCLGSSYDVYGLAFSPDGTLLASCGRDAPRLWDVATGRLLLTLQYRNTLTAVTFSPDGKSLAVSALGVHEEQGSVEVYALDYGRGLLRLHGLRSPVARIYLSADSRYVAALSENWQVGVWDFRIGRLLHVFEAPIGPWADNAGIAVSSDGRLACASWRDATLWEIAEGREVSRWALPPGLLNRFAFHPSGNLLLFRLETKDMQRSPDSSAHPAEHPRVCRVRDLLAGDPMKPLGELLTLNWHVFSASCPTDGRYFVVDGVSGTREKKEQRVLVYNTATDKVDWSHQYESKQGPRASPEPSLDPTGKFLAYHPTKVPGGLPLSVVELSGNVSRGTLPANTGALGPGVEWWITSAPYDASTQYFGHRLHRRGEENYLVTLGGDTLTAGGEVLFNATGTHAAWGNADGTVILCDIQEVRRRLAAVGLGW